MFVAFRFVKSGMDSLFKIILKSRDRSGCGNCFATSWETLTTPREEAFYHYKTPSGAIQRLIKRIVNESSATI